MPVFPLVFYRVARFGLTLVALAIVVSTSDGQISLTLDSPNQSSTAPAVGTTTLEFSGTVQVCPGCFMIFSSLDNPFDNSGTNSLVGMLDPAFAAFSEGGFGTYEGDLFSIAVPAGTAAGVYEFDMFGGTSDLNVHGASAGGSMFDPSASFTVTVVPEPTVVWLTIIGGAGLGFVRRSRRCRKVHAQSG